MRLLHTTTITLSSFDDDDSIPPYAILSHTWGDAETSFPDMSKNVESELKQSEGYLKIHACCAIAALQGHEYVWIDTCCIDKTSSAELSEAINSMYRWYEKAQVCYAYLADVYLSGQGIWNPDMKRQFRKSRWFTRGWTLQELFAPENLNLYDKDWREFGSKWSLREQISLATGIQVGHLYNMNKASAAQKMSWASARKTRRVEDMAYSLMGIFDVNMPMLYGEGEKAFIRLQHEIIKTTDDESIFAWTDHDLAKSGMFAKSPKAFARSGNVVPIMDNHPLFARRAPYTVTNRGFAIEIFPSKEYAPKSMTSQRFSLIPLNCSPESESAEATVKQLAIEVENVVRDAFVRSAPGLLKLPMWQYDMSVTSLVYIRSVYKYKPFKRQHSFFINNSSLSKRGLSILDTYDCQAERHHWDAPPDERYGSFTLGRGQSIAAVLLNGGRDGNWQQFGIIFVTERFLHIDLMTASSAQNFQEEMEKYKNGQTNPFSSVPSVSPPSVGPISLMLQDNRWVSIKLEEQRSTPLEERYFVKFERPCEKDRVYI